MDIKNKFVCSVQTAHQEKFNPFQVGYGVHKSAKYPNRRARKADARKEIKGAGY